MNLLKLLFIPFVSHALLTSPLPAENTSATMPLLEYQADVPETDSPIAYDTLLVAPTGTVEATSTLEATSTMVREVFGADLAPTMARIAECESTSREFGDDGNVITSTTSDFGFLQINSTTWDVKAKELGLDYKKSLLDNIKMAKIVYDIQGLGAWVCAHKLGMVK